MALDPTPLDDEIGRARRYPAATASLIIIGIVLLIAPKLVGSLFGWSLFGVPAGLVFVGVLWVGLIGLTWVSQSVLAPLILDREGGSDGADGDQASLDLTLPQEQQGQSTRATDEDDRRA